MSVSAFQTKERKVEAQFSGFSLKSRGIQHRTHICLTFTQAGKIQDSHVLCLDVWFQFLAWFPAKTGLRVAGDSSGSWVLATYMEPWVGFLVST